MRSPTTKEACEIAQSKMLKLWQIISMLHRERLKLKTIADRLDVSDRTVYRYIAVIEFLGMPIEKDFNDKYFIVVEDHCPLCGATNNHEDERRETIQGEESAVTSFVR